jgi:hypothetical protein
MFNRLRTKSLFRVLSCCLAVVALATASPATADMGEAETFLTLRVEPQMTGQIAIDAPRILANRGVLTRAYIAAGENCLGLPHQTGQCINIESWNTL